MKLQKGLAGLEPYEQGTFDSLCGLYAIINGIRLALVPRGGISKIQCRNLFKRGIEYLDDNECSDAVRDGVDRYSWQKLARHMFDHLYEKRIADFKCGRSAFRKLPDDCEAAIDQIECALRQGTPVAIELKKALNHYTVVSSIEGDRWLLFDSHGYKAVKKRSIGAGGCDARHVLGPKAIFFAPRF